MKQVILVDGKNLAFRVHYVFKDAATTDKKPTSVLHGIPSNLLRIHDEFPEAAFVICWDGEGDSWRHKTFKEYKANREFNEDRRRVIAQLPHIEKILTDLGFKSMKVEGVEADDIIGILSRQLSEEVKQILIYSSDRDMYQLLNDRVQVLKTKGAKGTKKELVVYGAAELEEEHGVGPTLWANFRAMTGDKTDNMKVLAGVGPVTAREMLFAGITPATPNFWDLEWEARNAYPRLKDHWPDVHQMYRLSYIIRDPYSKRWTTGQRDSIIEQLVGIQENPGRVPKYSDDMEKKWKKYLGTYELRELMERWRDIFEIP